MVKTDKEVVIPKEPTAKDPTAEKSEASMKHTPKMSLKLKKVMEKRLTILFLKHRSWKLSKNMNVKSLRLTLMMRMN